MYKQYNGFIKKILYLDGFFRIFLHVLKRIKIRYLDLNLHECITPQT